MTENARATDVQRQASDPTASAWVNANAGSGKTHVLIDRLIRLMLAGTEPSRILCLTFTKAAAAEMSTRLFQRLSGWITLAPDELAQALHATGVDDVGPEPQQRARRLFTSALETPGGLKIQTIHAFCERLLQLFPVEAGIVPRFSVLDERGAAELLLQARHSVLAEALADPRGGLGQALAEVARHAQPAGFEELLQGLIAERANLQPFIADASGVAAAQHSLRQKLALGSDEDEASVRAALAIEPASWRRLIAALRAGSPGDQKRAAELSRRLAEGAADLLQFEAVLFTKERQPRKSAGIATKAVMNSNPWVEGFVGAEQQRLATGLGKIADLAHIAATTALLMLASAILAAFEHEKRRRGSYDFDDLIIHTNRLLGEKPDAAWVLYKLDGGIEHVLLDEAQDTSPAQWAILEALTEEFFAGQGGRQRPDRTLFAVGDRKQSIYSFQGADPNIFEIVHDGFAARIKAAGQPFNAVDFNVSFRSAPEILRAVDVVFDKNARARGGLDGRTEKDLVHVATRNKIRGTVELWPLFEPEEREEQSPWQAPVDREPANSPRRRLARDIARKVKSWIGRRQAAGLDRPVEAGDILILVRVRNSFFDALIRELRKEGVPVAGADRLRLSANLAVLDVLALARFCLLRKDDYSLACVLKSPLLTTPLSEEQLFTIAWDRGAHSLWEKLHASADPACAAAAEQLRPLCQAAPGARPYEFFAGLLGQCRSRIIARLGGEANDALDAFLEQALAYEGEHASSLQGFVQWFAAGDIEIKRNMEQATDQVRIMTVHGAKGLEAPIVILPDTTAIPEVRGQASLLMLESGNSGLKLPLWRLPKQFESAAIANLKAGRKESRLEEYRRLLYVAMTRARDELYIGGYRGKNQPTEDCWYNIVSEPLRPVMHDLDDGAGWRLGADPVVVADVAGAAISRIGIPAWLLRPPVVEEAATPWSVPSHLGPAEPLAAQRVERGLLIHRILQALPEIDPVQRGSAIRRMVAKAGSAPALADELCVLVERPEFSALFGPDGLSEVPIMARVGGGGGTLISGRIDRLILRETEILVVDYKTDRSWPLRPEGVKPDYLAQMAAYAAALRAIHPGFPVRCAILWTSAPQLMEIPDLVLHAALNHNPVGHP